MPEQQVTNSRAELERLRKMKRLRELEAKAGGQQTIPQSSPAPATPVNIMNEGRDVPEYSRLQSAYEGAQRGATFGALDEVEGVQNMRSGNPIGRAMNFAQRSQPALFLGQNLADATLGIGLDAAGVGGKFREGAEARRQVEDDAREQNPVSFGGGEFVGSAAIPVGGSARAATKVGQVGKGIAAGAGSAGAYGFAAEDGSLEDRAKAGATGAAVGAAFGGTLASVIPRNIPLGDVLNAELFGAKVDRPVLKTIERMLIDAGVEARDIGPGVVQIGQRLKGGDVGSGLPTRFKDELVKQFGDKARGVSEAIETQIRGGAARSGSASDAAVRAMVSEDNAAARELFGSSLDQFAGSLSRPELRGQALDQLGEIVEQQYKPILSRGIEDSAKQQKLIETLSQPRMQALTKELAEDAEREGIDLATMIQQRPAEAAHWMQSKARELADSKASLGADGKVKPDRILVNRRKDILTALEDAVPGYRETRMEFGDKYGVTQAMNFARSFFSRAKDDVAISDMADEFQGMSEAQQQMAKASLRSLVQGAGEHSRFVDPELGPGALNTNQIGKNTFLDGVTKVFGEEGTKLADDIKSIVVRTDANRRINPQGTGSDTVPKAEAIKKAIGNTRGPIQKTIGSIFGGMPADLIGSALVGGPAPVGAARTGMQGVNALADKRGGATVDRVTELLLSRAQNAPARASGPPPSAPAGGSIIDQLPQQPAPAGVNALAPVKSAGVAGLRSDAGAGAVGGAVGGFAPAESTEERLRNVGVGAGGLALARRGGAAYKKALDRSVSQSVRNQPALPARGHRGPVTLDAYERAYQEAVAQTGIRKNNDPKNHAIAIELLTNAGFSREYADDVAVDAMRALDRASLKQGGGLRVVDNNQPPTSGMGFAGGGDAANALVGGAVGGAAPAESTEDRVRNVFAGAAIGATGSRLDRMLPKRGGSASARTGSDLPFNEGQTFYHATNAPEFSQFKVNPKGHNRLGKGVYLTSSQDDARGFLKDGRIVETHIRGDVFDAKRGSDEMVQEVAQRTGLDPQKVAKTILRPDGRYSGSDKATEMLRKAGFSGVTDTDGHFPSQVMVFDPADVQIKGQGGVSSAGFGDKPKTAQQAAKMEIPGSPEWEAARAKGFDMSQAGRMKRAKQMGFDTDTVLYHGTPSADISAFDLSRAAPGKFGKGVYFSTFAEEAGLHSGVGRGANIVPSFVRLKNPLQVDYRNNAANPLLEFKGRPEFDAVSKFWSGEDTTPQLRELGYDGVEVLHSNGGKEIVIFDPSNIRSVNAAFDPDNIASPVLTAGFGGGKPPKIKPDVPTGTPKQAGQSRMSGSIQRGLEESSSMGAAKATGDKAVRQKTAMSEANRMAEAGRNYVDVFDKTGVVLIPYKGGTIKYYAPGADHPDTVIRTFISDLNKPLEKRQPMTNSILSAIGEQEKPLMLGRANTPMIEGTGRNALAGQ